MKKELKMAGLQDQISAFQHGMMNAPAGRSLRIPQSFSEAYFLVPGKLVRMDPVYYRMVVSGRLQVLAQRQDVHTIGNQIIHGFQHIVFSFT
jgi:hypothetical protein